eukprot:6457040-Amphidinium_carterae.2
MQKNSGGGDCYWLAVAQSSLAPAGLSWRELKKAVLDAASTNAESLVGLLGADATKVIEQLHELRPDKVWGNQVAILATSLALRCTVIVQHKEQNKTWLVGPQAWTHERVLFLDLAKDHFQHWSPQQEGPLNVNGLPLTWMCLDGQPDPGLQQAWETLHGGLSGLRLMTWNIGSMQTRLANLAALSADVVCLQECACTSAQQHAYGKQLEEAGYKVLWGEPSRHKQSKRGCIVDKAGVPGVAVMAAAEVKVWEQPMCTPEAERLRVQGRLICCSFVDVPSGATYFLYNTYLPSGGTAAVVEQRRKGLSTVAAEVVARGMRYVIIAGDFNEDVRDNVCIAQLWDSGFTVPGYISENGLLAEGTYHSGTTCTFIDGIVCGPHVHTSAGVQKVQPLRGSQHSPVYLDLCLDPAGPEEVQPLPRGTKFGKRLYGPTPIDFQAVHDQVLKCLCEDRLDNAWKVFESAYYKHMCSCYEILAKGMSPCVPVTYRRSVVSKVGGELCPDQVALARLVQCLSRYQSHEHPGGGWKDELTALWGRVKPALNKEALALEGAWMDPSLLDSLVSQLSVMRAKERRQRISAWRKSLTDSHRRPSSQLYRWLRDEACGSSGVVVLNGETPCVSQQEVLKCLRSFWAQVNHCPDACWGSPPGLQPFLGAQLRAPDPKLLVEVVRELPQGKACGLDRWDASAVRHLPLEAAIVVDDVMRYCEAVGRWPCSFTDVRMAYVPKEQAHAVSVENFRPIAVTSLWWRAWARMHLHRGVGALLQALPQGLRGGVKGRSLMPVVIRLLLMVEDAVLSGEGSFGGACLDAQKCFDKITVSHALAAAATSGVPTHTLSGLAAFYAQSRRFNSVGGVVSDEGWQATLGLIQGCALSCALCCFITADWIEHLTMSGAVPFSFLDDRTFVGDLDRMQEHWDASAAWDTKERWVLNLRKSHTFAVPVGSGGRVFNGDQELANEDFFKLLGHQVSCMYNPPAKVFMQRFEEFCRCAARLGMLSLDPPVKLDAASVLLLTRGIYGCFGTVPSLTTLNKMTVKLKAAVFKHRRMTDFDCALAILHKPCRQHPLCVAISSHVMSLLQAFAEVPDLLELWTTVADRAPLHRARGPVGVLRFFLTRLGGEELDYVTWRLGGLDVSLRDTKMSWRKALDSACRQYLISTAVKRRKHLEGGGELDLDLLRTAIHAEARYHDSCLVSLVTDGVWTPSRKYAANLAQSAACSHCGEAHADIGHILHDCPQWVHLRTLPRNVLDAIKELPTCARTCAWPVKDMSADLRAHWRGYVLQCVTVLTAFYNATGGDEDQDVQDGDGPALRLPLPAVACPLSRYVGFRMPTSFSGNTSWAFPRTEFNSMTRYFMKLRWHVIDEDRCPARLTLLELYLDFLAFRGGWRFQTGIPEFSEEEVSRENVHGGWFVSQLRGFKSALSVWMKLTGANPPIQCCTVPIPWACALGVPKLDALTVCVNLLDPEAVNDMLLEGQSCIADLCAVLQTTRGVEAWRRWAPGIPLSQTQQVSERFGTSPLFDVPTRIVGKSPFASFRGEQVLAFRFWKSISEVEVSQECRELIRVHGVYSRRGLASLASVCRDQAKRAQDTARDVHKHVASGLHVVEGISVTGRDNCALCGKVSFMHHKRQWLAQSCNGRAPSGYVQTARSSLNLQACSLKAHADVLAALCCYTCDV